MKSFITVIVIAVTQFSQAQDAVPEEKTYDAFPIPEVPKLTIPETGRSIPYDRKNAKPVSVASRGRFVVQHSGQILRVAWGFKTMEQFLDAATKREL